MIPCPNVNCPTHQHSRPDPNVSYYILFNGLVLVYMEEKLSCDVGRSHMLLEIHFFFLAVLEIFYVL